MTTAEKPLTVIVAVTNHKGGVGKTSTCTNLASAFAKRGQKVLVCDLDGQANASLVIGKQHPSKVAVTIREVLLSDTPDILMDAIHDDTNLEGVHLIYGSIKLLKIENDLRARVRPAEVLVDKLRYLNGIYDIILIDCPPALNLLTHNALAAADYYIIPQPTGDQFGLYGMEDLIATVRDVRVANPKLELLGVLMMQHDNRKLVCKTMADTLRNQYSPVFNQTISHSTGVQQANMLKTTVVEMDRNNKVAKEYHKLAKEILAKLNMPDSLSGPSVDEEPENDTGEEVVGA